MKKVSAVKPTVLFFLILAAELMAAASPTYADKRQDELLQQAVVKESGERDLEGAIVLYQQVIDDSAGDFNTANDARLRMGVCDERLGKVAAAEKTYSDIIRTDSTTSERTKEAQRRLARLTAQNQQPLQSAGPVPATPRYRFQKTRFSLLGGVTLLNTDEKWIKPSIGFRIRLLPASRPLNFFLELSSTLPAGRSATSTHHSESDAGTLDSASTGDQYDASAGLVTEIPHGIQRSAIPEIGAGIAMVSSKSEYTTTVIDSKAGTSGEKTDSIVAPYLAFGVHLFPDHIVSLLLRATCIANPYRQDIEFQQPPHRESFDFPSELWGLGMQIQVKIGRARRVPDHLHE